MHMANIQTRTTADNAKVLSQINYKEPEQI